MRPRKAKPAPGKFAKGNRAAAKGEPRTVTLSVRLPERIAYKLASLAYSRCSRTDALIELIDDAVPDGAGEALRP